MKKNKKFNATRKEIDSFSNKLGEAIWIAMLDPDHMVEDMGANVASVLSKCTSDQEFKAANKMLKAVCGYNAKALVREIKERDADPEFSWATVEDFEE